VCGIAGFSGSFDATLLVRMSAAIAHRGPDGDGMFHDAEAGVGLAHRRLAIIDISPTGHQPMFDANGQIAVVFNGEIYNFRELRAELAAAGWSFRGASDTEVLLTAYMHWKDEFISRLNGIFAFAIWDGGSRELLLARDGLGVKPLYYAQMRKGVLFASEMKGLLNCHDLDRGIDVQALRSHLSLLWSPAPRTIVRSISKLEPGMAIRVANGRIVGHWRHYTLPVRAAKEPVAEGDAVRQVRSALRTAVRRQMVADVPVGAFLSGGLDSSAVVAFARENVSRSRLQCFTIALEDDASRREGMTADLPYAKRVAAHLGVDLHTVHVGSEMADDLPRMLYHLDEPQADPAPLNVLYISQLARQHGIKVLLSGAGGDDIFSGYRRHHALVRERLWSWLPQMARQILARGARALPTNGTQLRRLRRLLQYADQTDEARLLSYFLWLDPEQSARLLSPQLREEPYFDQLRLSLSELPAGISALDRMLYLECRYFLADHNLNYTDKLSMAVGVETRVPLLDVDLVDLAFRLPAQFKQNGAIGKWVLKQAMTGLLPDDVIHRPKTGFGAPLRAWLHGPLRSLLHDTLSPASLRRSGIFDAAAVERLITLDRDGRIDATYPLFAVLCFALWYRGLGAGQEPAVRKAG
jgi:asparagine synthase (glutamine-hydrolysing)